MVEMSLSLNSWNSKKALEMVREMMVNDSKGYLSDAVKLLGEGAYASVYKLKRKKDNKDVAVRISVTNDVNVCNRERRPRKLFDQLKVLKTPLTSSESDKRFRYDKFLSVPELKYDITFCRDGQKENISGYGLVFESELETGDADVDLSKPETIPKSEQFYKYLKKLSKSILKALSILHKQNKVHNDVKPNNILKREKGDGHFSFKLSDYGSMCTIKDFEEITKEDKKIF